VVTLTGVSKTYAMTGWRVGFLAAPRALMPALTVVQATATSGVSTIGQAAAVAALEGSQDFIAAQVAAYQARRDLVVAALNGMPGVSCHQPEGAFYVFPSVAGCIGKTTKAGRFIATDADFALALLEEGLVAVVQGAAFAASPHVRISTATSAAQLSRACARMAEFCDGLR
jgi:aspartate aminotransferase